jgi:DNA-binding transcriptional MocR family regulator
MQDAETPARLVTILAPNRHDWICKICCDPALGASAVPVGTLIALRFWNKNEKAAWPSQKSLAEMIGSSLNTVNRAISDLCKQGYLGKTRRFNGSNVYRLTLPDTPKMVNGQSENQEQEEGQRFTKFGDTFIPKMVHPTHQNWGTNHINEPCGALKRPKYVSVTDYQHPDQRDLLDRAGPDLPYHPVDDDDDAPPNRAEHYNPNYEDDDDDAPW